ncbi:MAG: hypothetical protein WC485_02635, partial [Opitutaceae bacterium]
DLWTKAINAQPDTTTVTWKYVGTLTETGTSDVSTIVFSAGAGVKLALSSPNGAGITYVLAKADAERFEDALKQVKAFLASPASG